MRIRELARLWFLLNRTGNEPDINAEILDAYEGTDTPLSDLLPGEPGALRFQHANPLIIVALDERVRRAAAMIIEDAVYEAYLTATTEDYFSLDDPKAIPSWKPLPAVHSDIRKKITTNR